MRKARFANLVIFGEKHGVLFLKAHCNLMFGIYGQLDNDGNTTASDCTYCGRLQST